MSAFKLPAGKVQISFSGGRTSALMLHEILAANGDLCPDSVRVVFANTGREMPETLDFAKEVQAQWGVHITWVEFDLNNPPRQRFRVVSHNSASRAGEPFDQLIEWKRVLPNALMRYCTRDLKIWPARDFLFSLGWNNWVNCVGLRADEMSRVKRPDKNKEWTRWHPLADAGITKEDVSEFWRRQPFDLKLDTVNGVTIEGNCDGCFLKSEAKLASLCRKFPDRFAWWEAHESRMSAARGDFGVFNKSRPLDKLRGFVESQGDWIFEMQDALCQADGGECIE